MPVRTAACAAQFTHVALLPVVNAQVIGYFRLDLTWAEQGTIEGQATFSGLPAVTYIYPIRQSDAMQFVPALFVVLFVVCHQIMTALDVVHAIRHKPVRLKTMLNGRVVTIEVEDLSRGLKQADSMGSQGLYRIGGNDNRGRYRQRMTPFWIGFEVFVSLMMLACVMLMYYYHFNLTPTAPFSISAGVYDAESHARSRYFMLRRVVSRMRVELSMCICTGIRANSQMLVCIVLHLPFRAILIDHSAPCLPSSSWSSVGHACRDSLQPRCMAAHHLIALFLRLHLIVDLAAT